MESAVTNARGAQPDFFAVLGLPRRLEIDTAALEATYHRLSRDVHPDFHLHKPADERDRLLARSALVNQAYRALRDFHERVEHLIALEGGAALKPKAPPELLEDVLAVQELLEECRAAGRLDPGGALSTRLTQERERLQSALDALEKELMDRSREWDAAPEDNGAGHEARRETLARLQDLLGQRVYVVNLLRDIDGVRIQEA
jgi:molecular chaperone HscB